MTVFDTFKTALREQGVPFRDVVDNFTGRGWLVGQFPCGTSVAVTTGSIQWRREGHEDRHWSAEGGNNLHITRLLRRGPPSDYKHTTTGLPADWTTRLRDR